MSARRLLGALAAAAIVTAPILLPGSAVAGNDPATPIEHFVMLMQENHTFDNYFGVYPGADGPPPGTCVPLKPRKPEQGCVEPYAIGQDPIEDLDHSESTFDIQYDGGRMDGFVRALALRNQDGRQAMGYYTEKELPFYYNLLERYVLFDRYFSSSKSGSLDNHMFWVTGTAGTGSPLPPGKGYDPGPTTIFDVLQERGISWKFYIQNYDPRITFRTRFDIRDEDRSSQVVWAPLLNYVRFVDDEELSSHIVDLDEYYTDLQEGTLPSVAYIVPSGSSEHPPGSLQAGQRFVRSLINTLMQSSSWDSSAFMVAYDDWGGWYDHVKPPQVDRWGYGFRVPAFLVSPYAKVGVIDSTELDFTSPLAFIEENWGLPPLARRDARANTFLSAFDFSQPPRSQTIVPYSREAPESDQGPPRSLFFWAYGAGMLLAAGAIAAAAMSAHRGPLAPVRPISEAGGGP